MMYAIVYQYCYKCLHKLNKVDGEAITVNVSWNSVRDKSSLRSGADGIDEAKGCNRK